MEDYRLVWFREKICAGFTDLKSLEVQSWFTAYNKRKNDIFKGLFNEECGFEILFIRESNEYIKFKKERIKQKEKQVQEFQNKNKGEEEEEEITRPGTIPLLTMDIDIIKESLHPHEIHILYFQRIKPGSIPKCRSSEHASLIMNEFLYVGQINKDPLILIKELIKEDVITDTSSFADRHIKKFANEIDKLIGDIPGEALIEIPYSVYALYKTPFLPEDSENDEETLAILSNTVWKWTEEIAKILEDINEKQKGNDSTGSDDSCLISDEIIEWDEKLTRLKSLVNQLSVPWIDKVISILIRGQIPQAEEFKRHCTQVHILLEEAEDNVKFLRTISQPTDILATSNDFTDMIGLLPTLMSSIRNIWVISKHYNTDKKICGLITKITNIIVSRVKEFIKFELLCEPERANHIAKNCKTLLSEWRRTYNKTREAIENSGREARWEFSVGSLFAPLEHCIFVCSDVIKVSNVLSQLSKCFSPALMSMTSKSEAMNKGNDKINSITESFKNLSFNVFEMKNEHHWRIHVAWFEREVRFLDAESARIAEETFDHLTSSGVSIKALEEMLGTNFRRAIGDRFMDKIDCIIKKFSKEIKCAEIDFDLAKDSPPIDKNFPPMSGAIYWAKDVGCNLEKSLNSLMRVDAVLSHSLWKKAKSIYDTFRAKLKDYETSRYNEWKSRVSDVLSENLTRTLLLADDPNDGFLSKRYRVNFTTDLSDTLAEVKHLDSLGFSVPEVAKNMSLQEERLIGVSDSLKNMLKRYHNSLDEIFPAEEELLFADIQETQVVLRPGHIRITWNSLGINEFILVGHQSISFVQTKINRIELIRKEIQSIADILSKTDLFSFECYSKVHFFSEFFLCISKNIKNRFEKLERLLLSLTPQFVKIEEILVQTRSRQAPRLKNYYAHWEMNIYEAIKELLLSNLDRYKEFIESRDPRFYIETILVDNNVSTDPSAPKVLDVMVGVIKEILEATKMFPRYYKGTWIPCKNISVDGEIKPLRSSMHDEIIRIPSIIDRVTHIQSLIVNILKESDNYLVSWKSYRTLWKFNKQQTCENFGRTIPTCVDFDEKLLFYYNLNRSIRNKEDHKDFKVMRLGLTKLKDGIQEHIIEWIQVLGKMLDSTATEKLKYLWDRVEYYRSQLKQVECTDEVEDTLKVISGIWSMSLEVEIGYLDIQERYRTLDMYGISGDKSMVVLAKNLTSKWEELYKMSKQVYFSIEKLKEKLSDIESSKILRFQSRLEELQGDFRQNGPSSKRTTLSNGLKALHKFKDLIGLFKEEAETLNGKQKVFKIPITHFPILRSLEKEMETIRDIYAIYEKLQDLFETLQDLPWGEYFTLAPGSQNYSKQKIFNIKREISFLEKSSTTHEGEGGLVVLGKLMDQLYSFEQYLNHLDCLQKGGLSQRHWKTLIEKTGLIFQEGDPQSYPDFKLKPFLNLPLNTLVEAISFVLETAENEDKIEKNYLKSLQIWKNKKFILESPRVRWQSFPMISNLSDLMTDLVEDDQNLDLMLSMKYAEPFKEKLEKHREILSKTGSVLKFIYETQNRCYSYAKVFISSEKQSYFENFGQIFKTYKGLMDELSRRVIVLDITLEDKTWKTYNEISRLLDSFSVQIHSFLDKKRQSFPRLYFLSNEELLILLGGCSPLALDQGKFVLKDDYMRVARKLFGFGVLSITLHKNHNHDYNPSALLLNNGDGLKIPGRASNNANSSFSQTSSNYLNWFSMIVKEMKKSFASTIKKALNLMTSENIETFLSRSESLSLICYEVYWTETLENFMEKGFHGLLSLLNEDIEVILGMEMKDSSKRRDHDRKNNFLNLLLSKKLGLSILIENQIRSKEDFTYQADFLRSYWNKNLETLTLKQGLGALDFEYEFQVPKTHFLTESPQATYGIMMALGWQRRSFCISGYPGSGKTSIIESMASRLGRYCVKIDNMIGFKNMEYRILELLAQTCVADCWLVIENIENIPQDMLSKISNPLYQIEAAKELRLQQFNLTPSKEINLGPNASVFFTTRGSTNYNNSIPQSLRSRWRHISLIPPKDLSPWISWKLSVLGYSGIERLTKLIILSIDQITNLSDSLMNHIGPYKLINDIFGSIEMSEGSESGSVMSAILHVTEYYILEEFKPGVKEFLRTRFGNEEIPPRSSLRNLILEERINSIWDQEFEKVEGLPGCTPSEKQKRSLVKAFQILEDSTGVCVAFIGDTGTGKCLMARVLANLLDSEFLFLSSSLYTAEELLNNNGIITSAIRNSNRKFTIILNPSMSNSIASVVANIIDKGIYINPSNYHSYKVETNSIKFVILLKPDEHLNSILIQRTRIIQLNERREVIVRMNLRLFFDSETSISDLYEKLSTIPITDPCLSFDSDQRLQQCVSLYKLFLLDFENSTQEESQLSVSSRLNTLVLSYIWSYGATLTDSNSVDDFEKRLRKIVKSYSDDIGLLQEESVFDQMYNGKEWARNENSLRRVVALLVHHGKGVFISGKLEADIWVDQFIKDMPEFHIVQIMLKRVAFTDRCLTQHLLSNMQIKGNRIYYPKSNRKLLYLVKGLSNEVDVDWMIDMSLHKSLHQYDQERDKITLRDVSILATLERGISGASSISKSNIFCPKYYKNQNPKSLDMTLLLPKNPDLSDNDKESINVVYKAYSSYNTNKGSLSSIKALGLTNMNIFSRLLKLDPQSWSKSLMKGLLEPLWSLEERRETLSFLHSHQINPDNEIKNENMGVISQLLDEGEVHHILLIGQGGSGKRALLKNYKPLWYWSFKELMDSSLENKDETRVVKAIESLVIPRDYPSLREQLDLMHQNVSAIVVICLNVEEFKVQDLKRVLSAFMEKFRIIGVPQASIYELKQVTQGFDIDSSILQNFLDIHDKIRTYFETMNIIIGNTSPWKLHKTLSIYKENVSKKKDSLEKAVNKSSFILTFIQKLNSKSLELKSELEIIKTQLNLHTKASLSNSQAIKNLESKLEEIRAEDVETRGFVDQIQKNIVTAKLEYSELLSQKRRDYDESLNIMSSLTMEDVIRFCSSKPVHESLIEAFLVFTNGHGPGQYEETNPSKTWETFRELFSTDLWAKNFKKIDPLMFGYREEFYLRQRLDEFHKNSEAPENSMGQIILKLCNGAYESAASFEDRLDLEIKIMAYENFVSDKISELEDITKKEDMIQLERQDYLDKKLDHKINMERLEKELETFEAYNTSAGNLLSLLSELGPHWKEEKERTMVILQNLESNEIFETIRDVYLRLLPRRILIQSIDQLFDGQIIHSEDCKKKGRKVDYFGLRDQFWRNILYYPEGSISQNICILHDPDDVYSYVLRKRKYKILHILCESDVQKIQEILRDRLDIVVPNFGGYINGKNENMGLLFRSLISSIPSDCESIVFLLIFEENQISNHETPYINLSLSEESFEDLDRLLKEIIHIHFSEDGRRIREIEVELECIQNGMEKLEEDIMKEMNSCDSVMLQNNDSLLYLLRNLSEKRKKYIFLEEEWIRHGEEREVVKEDEDYIKWILSLYFGLRYMKIMEKKEIPLISVMGFLGFALDRRNKKEVFERYALQFNGEDLRLFSFILHLKSKTSSMQELSLVMSAMGYPNDVLLESSLEGISRESKALIDSARISPEDIPRIMEAFIIESSTKIFGEPYGSKSIISIALNRIHKWTEKMNVIAGFILDASMEDPLCVLTDLADKEGIASTKVRFVGLDKEDLHSPFSLLTTAFIRGQWIIFQNLSNCPHFLFLLQQRLQETDFDDVHEDFRVWFTWNGPLGPSISLLQRALIIRVEPSREIRYHDSCIYYGIEIQREGADLDDKTENLIYGLIYLKRKWEMLSSYKTLYWQAPNFSIPTILLEESYHVLQNMDLRGKSHWLKTHYLRHIHEPHLNGKNDFDLAVMNEDIDKLLTQESLDFKREINEFLENVCLSTSMNSLLNINPYIDKVLHRLYRNRKKEEKSADLENDSSIIPLSDLNESLYSHLISSPCCPYPSTEEGAITLEKFHLFRCLKMAHIRNEPYSNIRTLQEKLTRLVSRAEDFDRTQIVDLRSLLQPKTYLAAVLLDSYKFLSAQNPSESFLDTSQELNVELFEVNEEGLGEINKGFLVKSLYLVGASWKENEVGPVINENALEIFSDLGIVRLVLREKERNQGGYLRIPLYQRLSSRSGYEFITYLRVCSVKETNLTAGHSQMSVIKNGIKFVIQTSS